MSTKSRKQKSIDILENALDSDLLELLLTDHASGHHIIWATDDYLSLGEQYSFSSPVIAELITGKNGQVIKPRAEKRVESQIQRTKDHAEVMTPSWCANIQNNQVDDAWFGKHSNRFNKECGTTWVSTYARKDQKDNRDRISFPKGKTWKDYVLDNRMEITCGEAPYLTSRYDTVTGKYIKPKNRIGLLDRKLRVITENVSDSSEWLEWAAKALQSIYAFEWQGDNILLARENLLMAVIEYYEETYHGIPEKEWFMKFAEIISWNVWQMDGIKYVIPESCRKEIHTELMITDNGCEEVSKETECPGCKKGKHYNHNGIYAVMKDWKENTVERAVDVFNGGSQR